MRADDKARAATAFMSCTTWQHHVKDSMFAVSSIGFRQAWHMRYNVQQSGFESEITRVVTRFE